MDEGKIVLYYSNRINFKDELLNKAKSLNIECINVEDNKHYIKVYNIEYLPVFIFLVNNKKIKESFYLDEVLSYKDRYINYKEKHG